MEMPRFDMELHEKGVYFVSSNVVLFSFLYERTYIS